MKIIALLLVFNVFNIRAQVKDSEEAHDILLGGWEAVQKRYPPLGRAQFYFYAGDTCDRRVVRPIHPKGCKPQDTVTVDKLWWKIIDFNKKSQIVKILLTPIRRTVKFSCESPSTPSPGMIYFKFISKDELIWRGDKGKYKKHFKRKRDQANWSAW